MRKSSLLLGISAIALSGGISPAARAQTTVAATNAAQLGTVVVTAERRKSSVQKTALTITVVKGTDITRHGDTELSQILQDVPGLQFQGNENSGDTGGAQSVGGAGGPPDIAIRGLGTDGPNKSPATAVYLDGVILQSGGADYYDVNRVEVLSGPQGTLYGRDATGGAVSIITNDPTQKFSVFGQVQYGSYNFLGGQMVVNIPLADVLALRVGFNGDEHRAYLKGESGHESEYNSRAKLLYKPIDTLSLLIGAEYYHADDNITQGVFEIDGYPKATSPAEPTNFDVVGGAARNPIEFHKYYADFDWNLGLTNVTYIPAYQTTHSFTGSSNPFTGYGQTVSPYNQTVTHEFRLANPDNSKLIWVAGLYYYHSDYAQLYSGGAGPTALFFTFPQYYTNNSIAGFGEATYPITSFLRLTGGARENSDGVRISTGGPPGSPPGELLSYSHRFEHFDWKARIDGDLSPTNLLYAMVSTGYRPGGFANGETYQNESLTSYEVGSKNRFSNITLNAAAFYYDYSGFQSLQSASVLIDGAYRPVSTVLVLPAKEYGLDIEASAYLTPNDKVSLSPELMQGTYSGNGSYAGNVVVANGKMLPHMTNFSVSGSYSHDFDLADGSVVTPDVDFHYQTKEITDFDTSNYPSLNPEFVQNAYGLINSSIDYTSPNGKYSVDVYGKNLSNTVYKLTDTVGGPGVSATLADPRTFGVIFQAHI